MSIPISKYIILKSSVFVLITILFTNCTETMSIAELEETINFSGVQENVKTRTSMNGNTASFATGDQVGVFEAVTGRNNVLYTYATPSWNTTTPMYWQNSTGLHQFYAYYPYQSTSSGNNIILPLLSAQTLAATPDPKCDLLVASLSQQKAPATVLNFTHAFALLKFNISFTGGVLSLLLPGKMTLYGGNNTGTSNWGMFNKINTINNISYNVSTQNMNITSNTSTTFQQSISFNIPTLISNSATVYVIVLPGTYTNPAPYVQFSMKLILTGLEVLSTNAPLTRTSFQPNTLYEYNVQVIKGLTRSNTPKNSIQIVLDEEKVHSNSSFHTY